VSYTDELGKLVEGTLPSGTSSFTDLFQEAKDIILNPEQFNQAAREVGLQLNAEINAKLNEYSKLYVVTEVVIKSIQGLNVNYGNSLISRLNSHQVIHDQIYNQYLDVTSKLSIMTEDLQDILTRLNQELASLSSFNSEVVVISKDPSRIQSIKTDSFLGGITDLLSGIKWIIIGVVAYKVVTLAASFKNKPKDTKEP
jgi:hypothetical protein